MAFDRFPRHGEPLVPALLKSSLTASLPIKYRFESFRTMADLDSSVWAHYSNDAIIEIARLVETEITSRMDQDGQSSWMRQRLGSQPAGFMLEQLRLSRRAFVGLSRKGYRDRPELLADASIGYLTLIREIGTQELLEVLASYESRQHEAGLTPGSIRKQKSENPDPVVVSQLLEVQNRLKKLSFEISVSRRDPRYGNLVQLLDPRSETLNQALARMNFERTNCNSKKVLQSVTELTDRLNAATNLTLEQELYEIVSSVSENRNADIIVQLLGFDGNGGTTLNVAGLTAGVSRERIRQIKSNFEARISSSPTHSPRLQSAVARIIENLPSTSSAISADLSNSGLTAINFDPNGIVNACDLFSVELGCVVERTGGSCLFLEPGDQGVPAKISSIASKVSSATGTGNILSVVERSSQSLDREVSEQLVRVTLQADSTFKIANCDPDWFWIPGKMINLNHRNRLMNHVTKILSISPTISLIELRRGLCRNYRTEGFAPPSRILKEIFSELNDFNVSNDIVTWLRPQEPLNVLSEVELMMAKFIVRNGPAVLRSDLESACKAQGMKHSTFYVYLGNSPILTRLAQGIYCLRGTQVPAGMVESLQFQARKAVRHQVLQDFGWTADGTIWINYRCSAGLINSGVIGIPAAMHKYIEGEYSLEDFNKVKSGTLVVKPPMGWGLGPFLRKQGTEEGDTLLLLFNSETQLVVASLGNDSLAEKLGAGAGISDHV